MLSLIIITSITMVFLTPLKLAFMITLMSIWVALMCYQMSSSIFCSSAVLISFSSGMMIILCYTAMMSNFESKNKNLSSFFNSVSMILLLLITKKTSSVSVKENVQSVVNSSTIIILMVLVICSMKSINQSIFNPSKSMISSY
uniref:NADH dehydrogenase subunit 6 n=1 Tax=Histiostomatidae sp. XFX TaxID=2652661 RepID=A0A5J6VC46_9ACAR|nr:NADH dehydrogenase subunit 6 [Histiostomatidae sp. XFX]